MASTAAARDAGPLGVSSSTPARGYHAFISYSHSADDRLAPALQDALRRFAKPWWRVRALRVFRDQSSLAADPALWSSIERALVDSDWFILLASPGAAGSHWVNRECEWWLTHRSPARMLIVLTDGSIAWDRARQDFDPARTTALPPALNSRFSEEPNHVDLRFARQKGQAEQRSLRHAGFRAAILDLAAPIHGVSKDLLDGEDVRQHRRTRWLAGLMVASLVVLAVAAVLAAIQAVRQKQEADRGRQVAESRQMAARSQVLLADGRLDAALLHAVEASRALTPELQVATGEWYDATASLMATLVNQGAAVDAIYPGGGNATLSADGSTLATNLGNAVVVWDTTTRRERLRHTARVESIWQMALSPDGRRLMLSSQLSSEVIFIDTTTGRELGAFKPGENGFHDICSSPDGRWLAVADDQAVSLWNIATLERSPLQPARQAAKVVGMAFDAVSSRLVYGSQDGRVMAFDLRSGQSGSLTLRPAPDSLDGLALAPDGSRLAATGSFGLAVWDLRSGSRLWTDRDAAVAARNGAQHDVQVVNAIVKQSPAQAAAAALAGDVTTMAISPDSQELVTGDDKGSIKRWRMAGAPRDGTLEHDTPARGTPLTLHRGSVVSLAFGLDGRKLFSAGGDGQLVQWDLGRPNSLFAAVPAAPAQLPDSIVGPWLDLLARPGLKLPDALGPGLKAVRRLSNPDRVVTAHCVRQDGEACASVAVRTWDSAGRRVDEWVLEKSGLSFGEVALGPSGDRVVTSRDLPDIVGDPQPQQQKVTVWERGAPAPREIVLNKTFSVGLRLSIPGNGQWLAVRDSDHVEVLDLKTGQPQGKLLRAGRFAWSPDGRRFAALEELGSGVVIAIRDTSSQELQAQLPVQIDRNQLSLAWSGDGEWLTVYGDNAAVALYDVSKRRRIGPVMRWAAQSPAEMAFAENRNALLLQGQDQRLLRLELDPRRWESMACRMANRNLTYDEWAALKGSACYRPTCADLPPDPDLASVPERLTRLGDPAAAAQVRQCLQKAPPVARAGT